MHLPSGQAAFVRVHAICVGLFVLAGLGGCQTSAQKARSTELAKPAAPEMSRICALHGEERAAELRKLKGQTGLELFCPND